MAESSCFRKIVDLIEQRAIASFVFGTVVVLLQIIFPPLLLLPLLLVEDIQQISDEDMAAFYFPLSTALHMFMDPLFLYVPLINEETKCVMLDNRLKIAAIILRSSGDCRYIVRMIFFILFGRRKPHSFKKIARRVAYDTVCIIPIPQVIILIFLPNMRGSRSLKIMKFLNSLILLQYLPRLYPIIKLYKQVNQVILDSFKKKKIEWIRMPSTKGIVIMPKWFGIGANIAGYILASHILGAFWYFFSIQREIDCWGNACQIENGCEFSTSCVENTFRNITHIKNLCPINRPNATVFDFGIFLYALQSGMQGSTNFPEKFLQCFSWGLRNLSSFASNLNSSTYGWENLFVVVITISGLVLFMYLLGHLQIYMQGTNRRENIEQKMKMIIEPKIRSLLSDYRLPSETESTSKMERRIKRAVEQILEKDDDFIVENMFSILSFNFPDEQQVHKESFNFWIKCNLFLGKLEKVERLKDKDEEVLKKICKHLEPMIYTEESYIIREGEPLDKMFFVTQGNVLTFATNNGGSSFSSGTIQLIEKEEDSWYGEELLTWAERSSSKLSTLPISTFTIKSHNKVEVFALKAVNLQKVVSESLGNVIEIESGQ